MARIRTIKPEFFTSEDIVALSPMARLYYIALWCEADKEGRLPWKPRTMKLRYFPADACDTDALAREVVASGLVILYGDGLAYIPAFAKHQHINPRESASTLPEPIASQRDSDASARVNSGIDPQVGREGKGREGNVEELEEPNGSSLSAASPTDDEDKPAADAKPPKPDPILRLAQVTDEATEAYNAICAKPHGLMPRAKPAGRQARQQHVKRVVELARAICVEEYEADKITPQFWTDYFTALQADDFHSGRLAGGKGHENWTPDFEYVTQRKTMLRIYERAGDGE